MKKLSSHIDKTTTVTIASIDTYGLKGHKLLEELQRVMDDVEPELKEHIDVFVNDRSIRLQHSRNKTNQELTEELERMKSDCITSLTSTYSSTMEELARITTDLHNLKEETHFE